jgi:hypothetical protein
MCGVSVTARECTGEPVSNCPLTLHSLDDNRLTEEGVKAVTRALQRVPALRTLEYALERFFLLLHQTR